MSDSDRFDDVTHKLVTGLDEIHVPPATLRATAPRRGFPFLTLAATALVVVVALALGAVLLTARFGSEPRAVPVLEMPREISRPSAAAIDSRLSQPQIGRAR